MREIKYRGIHPNLKQFITGLPAYGLDGEISMLQDDADTYYDVLPETLGQYTGLKDKNGKEIYEGDIFKAPHDFGPGGFDERQAVVHWHELEGYQWNYWLLDQLEVIGNIYETPAEVTP